jgi:DNA topoisomerase I
LPQSLSEPLSSGDLALLAAKQAQLRYVDDRQPGITRVRRGTGFVYRRPEGSLIKDSEELTRLEAIAVPPAWTDVWICIDPNGHIQATGRDARGRKQYRYHPRWRTVRDQTKYEHILSFGAVLPRLRRRVAADLARPGLPREKVLAAVVALMERTLARVGNPEYARQNESFGLTTLKNRHVRITAGRIELDFRAKSGGHHHSVVSDRKLAGILKKCRDLPGSELFQYIDEEGQQHSVESGDVNDYLRAASGQDITAKDFRTWAATNLAFQALNRSIDRQPSNRRLVQAIKEVAQQLGNTPAVCRKSYIHPAVMEAYLQGELRVKLAPAESESYPSEIWVFEQNVLRFLRSRTSGSSGHRTLRAALKKSIKIAANKHHIAGSLHG